MHTSPVQCTPAHPAWGVAAALWLPAGASAPNQPCPLAALSTRALGPARGEGAAAHQPVSAAAQRAPSPRAQYVPMRLCMSRCTVHRYSTYEGPAVDLGRTAAQAHWSVQMGTHIMCTLLLANLIFLCCVLKHKKRVPASSALPCLAPMPKHTFAHAHARPLTHRSSTSALKEPAYNQLS